jgi:hypothetical protein
VSRRVPTRAGAAISAAVFPKGRAWWIGAVVAVARRPALWPIALVETLAMAPRNWWRHWPPVPVPSPRWLAFRMETAYGDVAARPLPADVVAWLVWCKVSRRRTRLR